MLHINFAVASGESLAGGVATVGKGGWLEVHELDAALSIQSKFFFLHICDLPGGFL